jgi:nitroreductase
VTKTREGTIEDRSATATLARLLDERRSCRGFLEDPVPRQTIQRILDLAQRSPSWCNTQPWNVLITEGEETERFQGALADEAKCSDLTPEFPFPARYAGVFQERRRECGFQLHESVELHRADREASAVQAARNFELFGAPHAAVITSEADLGVRGEIDCTLYVQTFLLAAQSLGIGAIPQAALAAHAPFMRRFFGLPESRRLVCGISFGWPDHEHPANDFRTRGHRLSRACVGTTDSSGDERGPISTLLAVRHGCRGIEQEQVSDARRQR